jgi:hypothetical protein
MQRFGCASTPKSGATPRAGAPSGTTATCATVSGSTGAAFAWDFTSPKSVPRPIVDSVLIAGYSLSMRVPQPPRDAPGKAILRRLHTEAALTGDCADLQWSATDCVHVFSNGEILWRRRSSDDGNFQTYLVQRPTEHLVWYYEPNGKLHGFHLVPWYFRAWLATMGSLPLTFVSAVICAHLPWCDFYREYQGTTLLALYAAAWLAIFSIARAFRV